MKILIPTDGTHESLRAVKFVAARRAFWNNCQHELEVFNVQKALTENFYERSARRTMARLYAEQADSVFEAVYEPLQAGGCYAIFQYAVGDTVDKVVEEADQRNVDLILTGKRKRNDMRERMNESIAMGILNDTQCPMLILRDENIPDGADLRVGIGVDGSRYSYSSMVFAAQYPDFFGANAKFVLMHGHEGADEGTREAVKRKQLDCFDPLIERAGLNVEKVISDLDPVETVLRTIEEKKLDVLILGARGAGGYADAALGRTATAIMEKTNIPILFIQ